MEAVDVLYGSGDRLSRDIAYSETMRHLHELGSSVQMAALQGV